MSLMILAKEKTEYHNLSKKLFSKVHSQYQKIAHEYYNLTKFHQNPIKNKKNYQQEIFCKQTADTLFQFS